MEYKKDLQFICAQPVDRYFIWQVNIWLESLRTIKKSHEATVLIFVPKGRISEKQYWSGVQSIYPESEFVFFEDEDKIGSILPIYIPILRPYILMKYFKLHPELKNKAIFYCDADVVFTDKFNIDQYINDDICYLSDTNSYISAAYFNRKANDVLSDKKEEYEKRDILEEICSSVGISRKIAEKNNENSGGAQYLLKNIDWQFWDKVITDCIKIRTSLQNINKQFFESENKGFQSWCADMWAVLWNLWLREQETKVIPEMEFAWSSDRYEKINKVGILHNAGLTGRTMKISDTVSYPCFYKGDYINGKNPLNDPYLMELYNNEEAKNLCNYYYVEKMIEVKNKYYS